MEKTYSAVKVTKKGYKVYGPNENSVQNHRKKELPILKGGRLNAFVRVLMKFPGRTEGLPFWKPHRKTLLMRCSKTGVPKRELAESFSYCFLSTMMEAEEKNFTFEVKAAIKNGFLCRYFMTSASMNDLEMAKPLFLYFDQVGIDFTKNLSSKKEKQYNNSNIMTF